jgi:peptide methionine sulfoxide reductase MsrB
MKVAKGDALLQQPGNLLFKSEIRNFKAAGWLPSFLNKKIRIVVYKLDKSYGMVRTEALYGRCGGPFGTPFDDGPCQLLKDIV